MSSERRIRPGIKRRRYPRSIAAGSREFPRDDDTSIASGRGEATLMERSEFVCGE